MSRHVDSTVGDVTGNSGDASGSVGDVGNSGDVSDVGNFSDLLNVMDAGNPDLSDIGNVSDVQVVDVVAIDNNQDGSLIVYTDSNDLGHPPGPLKTPGDERRFR